MNYTFVFTNILDMKIDGFKKVDYGTLQTELKKANSAADIPALKIAAQINVNSVQTVWNAFNIEKQSVSDEVLSNVLDVLGIESFIVWQKGERNYYIKNGRN